jgi:hypothetical protein
MAKKINDSIDMAVALLQFDKQITEQKKYIENIETEVNQQDQELDILIDKLMELEKENMYLRLLLTKLLSNSDFTLEGLLNDGNTREETK